MSRKNMILAGMVIVLVVIFGLNRFPLKGKATLSWNANSEANLAGYKIYYGTAPRTGDCPPGGYGEKVSVKKETKYAFDNLEFGRTYYFSVTSFNSSGKESCFSPEIKKRIVSPRF